MNSNKKLPVINTDIILHILSEQQDVFFVEIGSNDGKVNDPLYPYISNFGWRGILVEPQKDLFENQLSQNYQHFPGVHLLNAAIGTENSSENLYKFSFTEARWATGLASLKKENLEKLIASGFIDRKAREEQILLPEDKSQWITSENVKTMTFDQLIKDYAVEKVDAIMIDTEGYDFEILKCINFNNLVPPKVIIYEHEHLIAEDYSESIKMLENLNYRVYREKRNTIAIHQTFKIPTLRFLNARIRAFLNKL